MHSASKIFQREIENLMKSVAFAKTWSDDILMIFSKNDEEQLKTSATVLKITWKNRLKLKLKKMYIYTTWITCLDYEVNEEGICLLLEKVGFIKNASPPQNVSQLKCSLDWVTKRFFIVHLHKQRQAEAAKNQTKAKQHSEAELWLFESYSLSSFILSSKNSRSILKNVQKISASILMKLYD